MLQLEILGRAVSLQRIIVLKKAMPAASPGFGDHVLGIDTMSGSFRWNQHAHPIRADWRSFR
jgi:hypothetical protein